MLLPRRIECIFPILKLGLQALKNLEVARELSWHLTDMFRLELSYSVFLVGQIFSCDLQLGLQELGRAFRLLLTNFQVLVNE